MASASEKFLKHVGGDLYYIANAQLCAKITCRSCRRCVITKADALLHLSRERRWKTDTRSIGERMKCQSCGHRGAIIKATMEAASVDPADYGEWLSVDTVGAFALARSFPAERMAVK